MVGVGARRGGTEMHWRIEAKVVLDDGLARARRLRTYPISHMDVKERREKNEPVHT
jgi:hypothetical protein